MKRFARRGVRAARQAARTVPFCVRQPLYPWTPGGFGYYRKLRHHADPGYVHERDKLPVRAKHHDADGLLPPHAEGFVRRDYDLRRVRRPTATDARRDPAPQQGPHQAIGHRGEVRFYRRFHPLVKLVPRDAAVLPRWAAGNRGRGAPRAGVPQRVRHRPQPGPENELVRVGDFNRLDEADASVDGRPVELPRTRDRSRRVLRRLRRRAQARRACDHDVHQEYQPGEAAPFEASLWLGREDVLVHAVPHFTRLLRVQAEPDWTRMLLQGLGRD